MSDIDFATAQPLRLPPGKVIAPERWAALSGSQRRYLMGQGVKPAIAGGSPEAVYMPTDAVDYQQWGGHNELLEAWWRDGIMPAFRESNRLTEAERLVEAETKMDFGTWLHGYVGASFYEAYEEAESQWRLYAGVKSLRDFNEHRIKGRNRLQGFGYVGDHAHRPGMRRSFRPEASLFIDTYGAEHEITRQAIINQLTDEILRDDPQDMGKAAAEYLANAIVSLMESNPTAPDGSPFFSTGRGNLSTSEISAAGLMAAWTSFQTRRDSTGLPVRIAPRRLIVQNRTVAAIVLREITSQQAAGVVNDPANGAFPRGTDNAVSKLPWPSDFVVEEPFLHDFNDAYMIADPARYPAWMVGLLQGQEQPQLYKNAPQRQSINGGLTDPYQLRVSNITFEVDWDIGVAAVNPDVAFAWRPA